MPQWSQAILSSSITRVATEEQEISPLNICPDSL